MTTRNTKKRRTAQLPITLPVRVAHSGGKFSPQDVVSVDLSTRGVLLREVEHDDGFLQALVEGDAKVTVRIQLQDGGKDWVETTGTLVWAETGDDCRVRVAFMDLNPEDEDRILMSMLPHYDGFDDPS